MQHGIGNDVYVEYIVCYHNGRYHTIEHDKGEKQREVAFAVVIIFAEEVEIKHEAQYEDADVQNLPCQHQLFLPDGLAALDGLFAQAFEDIVGFPAHYLAAVDDFLPAQYDAVCP